MGTTRPWTGSGAGVRHSSVLLPPFPPSAASGKPTRSITAIPVRAESFLTRSRASGVLVGILPAVFQSCTA